MFMENRYDKYKDSGIAWIGEIPEHWEVRKLKNVCSTNNASLSDKTSKEFEFDYVDIGSVSFELGIHKTEKYTFQNAPSRARKIARLGDIIVSTVRTYLRAIDIINSEEKEKYIYSTGFAVLSPLKNILSEFMIYICRSEYFTNQVSIYSTGINYPSINDTALKMINIVMPHLSEQQSIAYYLDQKCGEIDKLITLQEEMITKLQSYKQSVITEAVTKGLNKNVPLKDSGIEWIGEIPEHWEVKRLKYFGNNYNGLTYSPNDICSSQEGIIVLRSSNIKDNKLCFDDNVYVNKEIPTKLLVNKGDILICSRNGSASLIGKAALIETDIKATFGAFMMIFRGNNICHKYLYYIVTSCISQYKWLFTTATINQLTSSMLGEIFAPFICNKLEQQSIADYLDQRCSEIDELISIKQQKIEKLKEYKKSLIFECVTGKRKVS